MTTGIFNYWSGSAWQPLINSGVPGAQGVMGDTGKKVILDTHTSLSNNRSNVADSVDQVPAAWGAVTTPTNPCVVPDGGTHRVKVAISGVILFMFQFTISVAATDESSTARMINVRANNSLMTSATCNIGDRVSLTATAIDRFAVDDLINFSYWKVTGGAASVSLYLSAVVVASL